MIKVNQQEAEKMLAMASSRKSKINDIIGVIAEGVASLKAGETGVFTASELYKKESAHYYNLQLAIDNDKALTASIKTRRWIMNKGLHANFDKLIIVKK